MSHEHDSGRRVTNEERKNMEVFLALTYPAPDDLPRSQINSRSAETGTDSVHDDYSSIFSTQLPFEFGRKEDEGFGRDGVNSMTSINSNGTAKRQSSTANNFFPRSVGSGRGASRRNGGGSANGVTSANGTNRNASGLIHTRGGKMRNKGDRGERKKDFIQRNIQLATEAGAVMTGDEKKRLDELLGDLETIPEMLAPENQEGSKAVVALKATEDAYWMGANERQRMNDIDGRLKALLPAAEYLMVCSVTPSRGFPSERRRGSEEEMQVGRGLERDSVIDERHGERTITDKDGDLEAQLRDVDERLSRLATADDEHGYKPVLSHVRLQVLLDDCIRTTSRLSRMNERSSSEEEEYPPSSRTQLCITEHPRLDEKILRELLADARKTQSPACGDENNSAGLDAECKPGPSVVGSNDSVQDPRRRKEKFYSKNYDANSAWRLLTERDKNLFPPSLRSASHARRRTESQPPRSNSATFAPARATSSRESGIQRSFDEFSRRPFLPEIVRNGTLTSSAAVKRSFSHGQLGSEEDEHRVAPSLTLETCPLGAARLWNSLTSQRGAETLRSINSAAHHTNSIS